ncbi:neurensin-1-like [Uloborus diversus]|uniref:neurensin-1-like n=1 Tax=Uloborus diversus TaxID=327109 RepID=UPI002409B167|nr:neurensin-1-like [Uloborus diversus]
MQYTILRSLLFNAHGMQSKNEKSTLLGGDEPEQKEIVDQSKGARPKVRNPKEAKRRRYASKQAKSLSKPKLLESVSETEESQSLLSRSSKTESDLNSKGQEFFGVRSYVHTFYEAMAMDNVPDEPRCHFYSGNFRTPLRKRRKQVLCWRLTFFTGLLILCVGLTAILVGFLVPRRKEVVNIQEDIEIIDRVDQAFNRDLQLCKVVGIALFCTGGLIVAAVLLAMIAKMPKRDDPVEEIPMTEPDRGPTSPVGTKVPATEELKPVQPKRMDAEKLVMTHAGLCQLP